MASIHKLCNVQRTLESSGNVLSALLNLNMAFGRPLVGPASDKYRQINISGLMTLITGLSCFAIWLPAKVFGAAAPFSLGNGAICGTFWTTIAPVWYLFSPLIPSPPLFSSNCPELLSVCGFLMAGLLLTILFGMYVASK